MASSPSAAEPLWRETPLIYSESISQRLNCHCYLKLENLQFSHSFKYRGLSLFAQRIHDTKGRDAHLVIASGGNAGLALAHAAHRVGLRCTVFLPLGTQALVPLLERVSATACLGGTSYDEARQAAEIFVQQADEAFMVHPYDDPSLWEGIGSISQEISTQLPPSTKPDAIFCSVGGASLIGGIMLGCENVGWDDVPVVSMETHGSACFYHSVLSNTLDSYTLPEGTVSNVDLETQVKVATIPCIASRASSLGAITPSARIVKMALDRPGPVHCVTVADELAMRVVAEFADEHKLLVELACSTALSPAYTPSLFNKILSVTSDSPNSGKDRTIIFIVCGGNKISLAELAAYKAALEAGGAESAREVHIRGEMWFIED